MTHDLSQSALVLVGHGSTLNPDSSTPTQEQARILRQRGTFSEVHACFWKEEPSLREVLRMVESKEIFVIPHFISEGYFTRKVIPRELELEGTVTRRAGRTIRYGLPVGSHPLMTEVLLHKARSVAPDAPPEKTTLLIVGHGTDLNENSARAAKEQTARIRARGDYAEVAPAYMEEPPLISDWDQLTTQPHVVVVPFFIADGLHSYEDIPVLLGLEKEGTTPTGRHRIFRQNPRHLRGRRLYYADAIGNVPLMADIIIDQVRNVLAAE